MGGTRRCGQGELASVKGGRAGVALLAFTTGGAAKGELMRGAG